MKLLEKHDWKFEILLITVKTGFCSLIFHMLANYIGPNDPKDFCNRLTWQMARKLIAINSFFKDASVILLNIISSKGTFSKPSTTSSSYNFQNIFKRFSSQLQAICMPADWENLNLLKMFLSITAANLPRTYIFITKNLFNERLSVAS